ncbi:flippase [Colwellia sp. D2M02]|uniref:flippase n=1 Tax=Colwellia sp. D2M02 TaxID=2841562 RepID=UPI001C09D9A8|nr:flippase [Colwellia sp. D2M02]MBU2891925.1 flippase [Colwellia sp. D2M02]
MQLSINVKNSLLLVGEKAILLGMGFITSVLMARIGGPAFFGDFSYITAFVALFIPLCSMGLNSVSTKYFVLYPKHNHIHFKTILLLRALGAVFCITIGTLAALFFLPTNESTIYILVLLALQSFSFIYLVEHYYLAKQKVTYTLKIRLIVCLLISVGKIIALLLEYSLLTLILIHGLEFILIGISYITLYYQHKPTQKEQLYTRLSTGTALAFFHKGKWLLLSSFAAILYLKIDQVMLASMYGTEEVAFYAAASKLSEFWYVFPVLIANVFHPKLLKLKQQGQVLYSHFLLKSLSYMVAISLLISTVIFILAPMIINIIYGEEYKASASILSIHIFATLFIFQRAIFSKWLIIEGHYKFSLFSHAAGAITNITLNLILIPNYGGVGAAWATLLSYMVASFLSLIVTRKTREFMLLMINAMIMWPRYLTPTKVDNAVK